MTDDPTYLAKLSCALRTLSTGAEASAKALRYAGLKPPPGAVANGKLLGNAADAIDALAAALAPLAAIWSAYLGNHLDDEARRFRGKSGQERENDSPLTDIELYQGRGGKRLLTLADALNAHEALGGIQEKPAISLERIAKALRQAVCAESPNGDWPDLDDPFDPAELRIAKRVLEALQ